MIDITTYILARGYTAGAIAQFSESGAAKMKEVEIADVSGQIPEAELNSLLSSSGSIIKLEGKYYRLARIEGDNYKYINSTTTGAGQTCNMTELTVDKNTGDFTTKQILFASASVQYVEDELQAHVMDSSAHVSTSDRTN